MEFFVIALREGVEASLVLGVIVAYLRRTGRSHLVGRVFAGLGLAGAASVAAGFVLPRLFESVLNEEAYEGALMLLSAALIGTLAIWMARAGKRISKAIEDRMETISGTRSAALGVLLFAFLMTFREGAEIVLLFTVLDPGTESVMKILGAILGLALAVVFGVGFVRGTARIDLRRFFRVSTIVLLVLCGLLLVGGVHEFAEAGIVPAGPREMAVLGPVVHNNFLVFSAVLLVVAGVAYLGGRRRPAVEASNGPIHAGAAAERKQAFLLRVERRWRIALVGLAGVFVIVLTGFQIYSAPPGIEPAIRVSAVDGEVRIPVRDVEEARMRFYDHGEGDGAVRFFVLRVDADRYEVCLDACEICGPKGYYLRGPELICRNCIAPINLGSVGNPGGCNPIPIPSVVRGSEVVIRAADLQGR